nr:MAG TPA: hypothetical protein [Caudoviricetes sp.]
MSFLLYLCLSFRAMRSHRRFCPAYYRGTQTAMWSYGYSMLAVIVS